MAVIEQGSEPKGNRSGKIDQEIRSRNFDWKIVSEQLLCNIVQCFVISCNIVQHCTILCSAMQCGAMLLDHAILHRFATLCRIAQSCAKACNIGLFCAIVHYRATLEAQISGNSVPGEAPGWPRSSQNRFREALGTPPGTKEGSDRVSGASQYVPGVPGESPKTPRDSKKSIEDGSGACRSTQNRR